MCCVHVQLKEEDKEGGEGAVGNQRRGGTTPKHEMSRQPPCLMTGSRARLPVYTAHVLFDHFKHDKHVQGPVCHAFFPWPNVQNTHCFNDGDLFIAPTTRQQPAEAASTKGPLQ
jgi:hypothetical protein